MVNPWLSPLWPDHRHLERAAIGGSMRQANDDPALKLIIYTPLGPINRRGDGDTGRGAGLLAPHNMD
jgi:hypothetical protein